MVQEVLNHPDDDPARDLKILRLFQGRLIPIMFERGNAEVLKVVLLPGDQVTF
jgi:hypothetical protein